MAPLHFTKQSVGEAPSKAFCDLLEGGITSDSHSKAIVRAKLYAATRDIAVLNDELSHIEAYTERVQAHRKELMQFASKYPASAFPLPNEILSYIFTLSRSHAYPNILDTSQWPWPLTMVCSHWRSVAISMPTLWTSIQIDAEKKKTQPAHALYLVRLFLQRSGDKPLRVTITRDCMDASHRAALQLLLATCKRWQQLFLHDVTLPSHGSCSFSSLRDNLPMLRELELGNYFDNLDLSSPELWDIFWQAPALVQVKTCLSLAAFQLPWHQIKNLTYDALAEDDDIVDMLNNTPQLIHCKLGSSHSYNVPNSQSIITLPHLRTLDLDRNAAVIRVLTLPALESLRISMFEIDIESVHLYLNLTVTRTMIARSRCSLRNLELHCPLLDHEDELLDLLRETPSLVKLEVKGLRFVTSRFFQSLTLRSGEESIVPDLEHLELKTDDDGAKDGRRWSQRGSRPLAYHAGVSPQAQACSHRRISGQSCLPVAVLPPKASSGSWP